MIDGMVDLVEVINDTYPDALEKATASLRSVRR